ncbi:unnamed protein product [Meloidogyne enterolobii]|uniref:Uncharacterized protein n=1 Tax=Meloidogyne enterolobii TaxID=390850 RepID=A0ACB0YPS3_MELEN
MFYSLPTEIKLDIFKCLNYEKLYLAKQTNLYFRDFINNFEEELARERFDSISIGYISQFSGFPLKLIKAKENFDFDFFAKQYKIINEQIEQKWSNGLQDPIHLYLPDGRLTDSSIVICLARVHYNILQLPTIIKTKEDIKIVFYYLCRLFNCYFGYANFDEFIFNPELLQLLFGNTKIPKQIYLMRDAFLKHSKAYNSEKLLKFVVNHLICKSYRIYFSLENNTKEYVDILHKILINGDKLRNVNIMCSYSMPELFDFVINYIKTSKYCSKMVDKIELDKIGSSFDSLNAKAEKVEEASERRGKPKYQISNIYNPQIKFSIGCRVFSSNGVKFKRIYC